VNETIRSRSRINRVFSLLVPYLAIGIGLLWFRSAWMAILSYHAGMVLMVVLSRTRVPWRAVFRTNNLLIPLIITLIAACSGLLVYLLWPLLSITSDISRYLLKMGLTPETWPYFLAYFILVNPLIEEYYWRGYLGDNTRQIILADFMFSGYHVIVLVGEIKLIWMGVMFLALMAGAWIWRQSDRLSEGLLPSVISHLAADISIMLAVYGITLIRP
jgi:uncharacterized protein